MSNNWLPSMRKLCRRIRSRDTNKSCSDKERQADEKQINKLYKDVTTGMLRRKRGGDFDELDDSDDDLAERRRTKQEEFARMRRALLADENINKLGKFKFFVLSN